MSARPQIRINSVIVEVLTIYISPESEFISVKTHDLKPYRPKLAQIRTRTQQAWFWFY